MKQFKDSTGKSWDIAVNALSIWRVRDLAKVNIPGLFNDKMKGYLEFLGDPVAQSNVLWVLVQKQADGRSVSEDTFKESLDGDATEGALAALQEEIIDFFPKAQRTPLRKTLEKMKTLGEAVLEKGMTHLDSLGDREVDEFLKTLEQRLTNSSGGPLQSSESTQAPSLSASS